MKTLYGHTRNEVRTPVYFRVRESWRSTDFAEGPSAQLKAEEIVK